MDMDNSRPGMTCGCTVCRKKPIVVLSEDLLQAPEAVLRALCAKTGMPWDPAMLRWSAGPKPYDGVWAPWWYKTAHSSTGAYALFSTAVCRPYGYKLGTLSITMYFTTGMA
jgi:hypothetical protein